MKLKDFAKLVKTELGSEDIVASNIDDIFILLRKYDLKEITIAKEEMLLLVRVYLFNIQGDKNGHQVKVIKEGKIDRFYGVDLIEE